MLIPGQAPTSPPEPQASPDRELGSDLELEPGQGQGVRPELGPDQELGSGSGRELGPDRELGSG